MDKGSCCSGGMCTVHKVSMVILLIGGLNWGAVAFGYNFVDQLFVAGSTASMVVYGLVGLSAIMMLFSKKCCGGDKMGKSCGK
ncbi:MAG: DUF378 domain-containing protein [Patescibacteria group bacterium]